MLSELIFRVSVMGICLSIRGSNQPSVINQCNKPVAAVTRTGVEKIEEERIRSWIAAASPEQVVFTYPLLFRRSPEIAQTIPCLPPLEDWSGNRVSSGFGHRTHPTLHTRQHHNGIDIAGFNQYVRAAASGRVIAVTYSGSLGRYVQVDHGNSYETLYGHLALTTVRVGQRIGIGQTLGITGRTGRSTGIHLHYSVLKHNVPVNPADYLLLAIRFVEQYQQHLRSGSQSN